MLHGFESKVERVPWERGDRTDAFALFSVSSFTGELRELASVRDDVLLVDGSNEETL